MAAAAAARRGVERVDLVAVRAGLGAYACRCDGGFALAADVDVDRVGLAVPSAVAGEVQDQAVDLAVGLAGAAADHLHVDSVDSVGRSMARRSTRGASKPVVSTLTLTRHRTMPALNAAMLSSRSGSGVSPVTTRHEMPRAQSASPT